MDQPITDREFALFQQLIYRLAGISLSDAKRVMLVGRLGRRLGHYGLSTYSEYYRLLESEEHPEELQTMVDLVTTNETYFFREPQHFDFLRELVVARGNDKRMFRIWSGASSSGQEAYSMAMVLAEHRPPGSWEVFGSDISLSILERARAGIYSVERTAGITAEFLRKYCLKGVRSRDGTLRISPELQKSVRFEQVNLTRPIPRVGEFDAIFLRNVMIYFDAETKRKVVEHMLPALKPGGHFIVGHSESLSGINERLKMVRPTIYCKPL